MSDLIQQLQLLLQLLQSAPSSVSTPVQQALQAAVSAALQTAQANPGSTYSSATLLPSDTLPVGALAATPELDSLTLFGMGILALGAYFWRVRHRRRAHTGDSTRTE